MNPSFEASDSGSFVSYYRTSLCYMQKTNNDRLKRILEKNYLSAFFTDRSISFLNSRNLTLSLTEDEECALVDEFRNKVSLTKYDDYHDYIDRMIHDGEENLLTSAAIIFYARSSGTSAKSKFVPVTESMPKQISIYGAVAQSVIWRSFPLSSYPSLEQIPFQIYNGKKAKFFPRAKNGTPMGTLSQIASFPPFDSASKRFVSGLDNKALDLIDEINNYDINTFVQLVFALSIPNIYSYTTLFAPAFIHSVKVIQNYYEEISLCISSGNLDHSSLVRENIQDAELKTNLGTALIEITDRYGGETYRSERANHIRQECRTKDVPGILHRLWPTLIYASTSLGSTFAVHKEEIQFYCGKKLPLINIFAYAASEAYLGTAASIHTDEYILFPTSVFYEFIKEEDIHQEQPKTLLISEIEPGNRYELVCTTEGGLNRYRIGDVLQCTRFLSRTEDLVPLPSEPEEIPRIPLVSLAYRIGSLLDIYGEKTNEQHVMNALEQTVDGWKVQGIHIRIRNFTSCTNLDAVPANYVLFLELNNEYEQDVDDEQLRMLQKNVSSEVDKQLHITNEYYANFRAMERLGQLSCIIVRCGTFSSFLKELLKSGRVAFGQIKCPRLLHNQQSIQFFYDHQINLSNS